MDPAIIGAGLNLIGGLLGKEKKESTWMATRDSIFAKAYSARNAGKKFGFNPLTLLQNSSQLGGGVVGGPPPLASALQSLGGFISDNYGKEANDRREHNKLQTELLRLEVDKARSLRAVAPPPSAVRAMGPTPIGGNTAIRLEEGHRDFIGPREPVTVRNALNGTWVALDAAVADRLNLKAGDAMIGEDNEALMGDLASEIYTGGSITTGELYGTGPWQESSAKPKPLPKRPVSKTPDKFTGNHLVPMDWWKH